MIYRGYEIAHVTRKMPMGQLDECVQISGHGQVTYATTEPLAKRAIDGWEREAETIEPTQDQPKTVVKGGRKNAAKAVKDGPIRDHV